MEKRVKMFNENDPRAARLFERISKDVKESKIRLHRDRRKVEAQNKIEKISECYPKWLRL